MPEAIYTPENCQAAYQLDWAYSVFWNEPPSDELWLEPLRMAAVSDSIRVLQHQFEPPKTSKFLVSTQPHVCPLLSGSAPQGTLAAPHSHGTFRRISP